MQKTVLVAGRAGQLAHALSEAEIGADLRGTQLGRPDFDILSGESIRAAFDRTRPDLVIKAAAYSNADGAETDAEAALALSAGAAAHLAAEAELRSVPLIHISTDNVFDWVKIGFYRENDPVTPSVSMAPRSLPASRRLLPTAATALSCVPPEPTALRGAISSRPSCPLPCGRMRSAS